MHEFQQAPGIRTKSPLPSAVVKEAVLPQQRFAFKPVSAVCLVRSVEVTFLLQVIDIVRSYETWRTRTQRSFRAELARTSFGPSFEREPGDGGRRG
jgi:hypothetical protein